MTASASLFLPDGIEILTLGLHSDVAIVFEYLARDVASDIHDRLVTGAAFSVLTYGGKRFYISGDTEGIPEMRASSA